MAILAQARRNRNWVSFRGYLDMCYSGRCLFEDHIGKCQIWNLDYNEFEKKYGYRACQVGGSYEYLDEDNLKDVEYYKEHEEEFKSIYRDYMRNRFKVG